MKTAVNIYTTVFSETTQKNNYTVYREGIWQQLQDMTFPLYQWYSLHQDPTAGHAPRTAARYPLCTASSSVHCIRIVSCELTAQLYMHKYTDDMEGSPMGQHPTPPMTVTYSPPV
jgi:hypothetical protein